MKHKKHDRFSNSLYPGRPAIILSYFLWREQEDNLVFVKASLNKIFFNNLENFFLAPQIIIDF